MENNFENYNLEFAKGLKKHFLFTALDESSHAKDTHTSLASTFWSYFTVLRVAVVFFILLVVGNLIFLGSLDSIDSRRIYAQNSHAVLMPVLAVTDQNFAKEMNLTVLANSDWQLPEGVDRQNRVTTLKLKHYDVVSECQNTYPFPEELASIEIDESYTKDGYSFHGKLLHKDGSSSEIPVHNTQKENLHSEDTVIASHEEAFGLLGGKASEITCDEDLYLLKVHKEYSTSDGELKKLIFSITDSTGNERDIFDVMITQVLRI